MAGNSIKNKPKYKALKRSEARAAVIREVLVSDTIRRHKPAPDVPHTPAPRIAERNTATTTMSTARENHGQGNDQSRQPTLKRNGHRPVTPKPGRASAASAKRPRKSAAR